MRAKGGGGKSFAPDPHHRMLALAVGWEILEEYRAEFAVCASNETPFLFTVSERDGQSLAQLYNRKNEETSRLVRLYLNQIMRKYDFPYRVNNALNRPGTDEYRCIIRKMKVVQK